MLDATLTDEKLAELLADQAYPNLDFKRRIDPTTTKRRVELALHLGAMQVHGCYLVVGAHGHGRPSAEIDDIDPTAFDEATLGPRARKYLSDPLASDAAEFPP